MSSSNNCDTHVDGPYLRQPLHSRNGFSPAPPRRTNRARVTKDAHVHGIRTDGPHDTCPYRARDCIFQAPGKKHFVVVGWCTKGTTPEWNWPLATHARTLGHLYLQSKLSAHTYTNIRGVCIYDAACWSRWWWWPRRARTYTWGDDRTPQATMTTTTSVRTTCLRDIRASLLWIECLMLDFAVVLLCSWGWWFCF